MRSRIAFIINAAACQGANRPWFERNKNALNALAGERAVVLVESGAEIEAATRRALEAQPAAIVAGGGDGTLNAVASHLVGTDVALGVLPLGTLNHFAKDLGIPADLDAALHIAVTGETIQVDVGEVNGHIFLNNSSLGLYPDAVREREKQQSRLGRGKWLAFLWAIVGVLRRYPFLSIHMTLDGKAHFHRTPFVFIGNNEYRMEGFNIGERSGIAAGTLNLYTAERTGRWGLVRLGLHAIFGRLKQVKDFRAVLAREILITTHPQHHRRHRRLRVAIDGEVLLLETPLKYRVRPGALRVIVPARASRANGSD